LHAREGEGKKERTKKEEEGRTVITRTKSLTTHHHEQILYERPTVHKQFQRGRRYLRHCSVKLFARKRIINKSNGKTNKGKEPIAGNWRGEEGERDREIIRKTFSSVGV
jgi:hypothetical protein